MNLLKRNLAPLTEEAWEEIDDRAAEVLKACLSARRVVHVNGPMGLDYTAVPEGRLVDISGDDGDVQSGIYKIQPLTEARISFSLDLKELDNLQRGAKDIDFEPLEEATRKMALFEDHAVYNGLENGPIKGIINSANSETLPFGNEGKSIMDAVFEGRIRLQNAFASKPYTLVVGEKALQLIDTELGAYPLKKRIEDLLGTSIVYSPTLEGAIMVPYNNEDLEMTIGQDLAIGYVSHNNKTVDLFVTESFTFRALDPNIIVNYTL